MTQISAQTSYLYAIPSFSGGMANILDFASNLEIYNESKTPQEADQKALHNDWAAVGMDILTGMENYEKQEKQS